jgi:hypothetical protein
VLVTVDGLDLGARVAGEVPASIALRASAISAS